MKFLAKTNGFQRLFILFLLISPSILRGTHLVGGELTYKFMSRNGKQISYRFTLKIYRDAFSVNPQSGQPTPLDQNSNLAVYIQNGTGYKLFGINNGTGKYSVPLTSPKPVPPPNTPCLKVPDNAKVEEGTYEWDATLLDTNVSYVVAYQRCCRNTTIDNIAANNVGSTYSVEITPESQRTNNSSPTFKNFAPIAICIGTPLSFDHSAVDVDGDSLVYGFCTPFRGASSGSPTTNPPSPPPYTSVTFLSPYTFSNPLGGSPTVGIDAKTGILFGTPSVQGQFVVSVCVDEYKNGKLIGRIVRDFQFNVTLCQKDIDAIVGSDSTSTASTDPGRPTAALIKQYFINGCEKVTVLLDNQSKGRDKIGTNFYWEFKVDTATIRFTEWTPSITIKDTGTYRGKLFLRPGDPICSDSAEIIIKLGERINPNVSVKYDTCIAGPIQFKSLAKSSSTFKEIKWTYDDGKIDSNLLLTQREFEKPGLKTIKFFVRDKLGCKSDTTFKVNWQPAPKNVEIVPDKLFGCIPDKINFKFNAQPVDSATYKFDWTFGDGASSNQYNPSHLYTVPDIYSVKLQITSPLGCTKSRKNINWIKIRNKPKADFDYSPKFVTNINPTIQLENKSSEDTKYWSWYVGKKGYLNTENPTYSFVDTGYQTIRLNVRNTEGCIDSMTQTIYVEPSAAYFLPTAFTPNEDAMNDVFKATGLYFDLIKNFQFTILSRWGEVIFKTNDPQQGWNGLKNNTGEQSANGVYMYEILYTTPTGKQISKRDFVTLIR